MTYSKKKYPDLLAGVIPFLTHYLPVPHILQSYFLNFVVLKLALNFDLVPFTLNEVKYIK